MSSSKPICVWCAGDGWDSAFKQFNGKKCRRCKGSGKLQLISLETVIKILTKP